VCYYSAMIPKHAREALIIFNPVSGQGDSAERKEQIVQLASDIGWQGRLIETTRERTATSIAKRAITAGTKHIVVCGGDGTILETLQGAFQKHVAIGVVPLGTGNLFAQNLDLPLDIKEALLVAFLGKVKKIDLGKANGTFFSIMAGIGLDAHIMKSAPRKLKDKFGFLAYVFSAAKNIQRRAGNYHVIIDGTKEYTVHAKSIMIANMGEIQGGIRAVPRAHPQSGQLRVGIIHATSWHHWVNLAINAIKGNVNKSPHYTLLQGKHIAIQTLNGAKPYQCDGNYFPSTEKLTIDIYPASVSVLT
jgi:diacylglycerol kinase (ATP)